MCRGGNWPPRHTFLGHSPRAFRPERSLQFYTERNIFFGFRAVPVGWQRRRKCLISYKKARKTSGELASGECAGIIYPARNVGFSRQLRPVHRLSVSTVTHRLNVDKLSNDTDRQLSFSFVFFVPYCIVEQIGLAAAAIMRSKLLQSAAKMRRCGRCWWWRVAHI